MAQPTLEILGDWDFLDGHVQNLGDQANFVSAESSIICAGPAEISSLAEVGASGKLIPIGVVQNVQITQNKQIQQLFEVGSRKPFFIPGRTLIQVGISRAMFDGPSLMKALYDYSDDGITATPKYTPNDEVTASDNADVVAPTDPYDDTTYTGPFYINLASEFFNRPLGLALVIRTSTDAKYGGIYLENCYIQTHDMALAGQQTVVLENVGIRSSSLVPFEGATDTT